MTRILINLFAASLLSSAAPFPSNSLFTGEGLRGMSWSVDSSSGQPLIHSVMHDLGSGSLRYARISQNFASINFEYFGVSQSPPAPNQPQSYSSIALGSNGELAVAYTAFESLPVPAYHLYLAKRSTGGTWTTQKVLEIVNINRIQLALRNQNVDEWRIAYSNPSVGEIRLVSAEGYNTKVCDLVAPAPDVGFDMLYIGPQGIIAYHNPIDQKLYFTYLIDLQTGTFLSNPAVVDSGPGVGMDARFARNNAMGQFGNHYLTYRDTVRNEIKMAKFVFSNNEEAWFPETVIKGGENTLRRPAIALNSRGEPIIACFRESWNDLHFSQRLQGRWYSGRHATGAGFAHVPIMAIVPESAGAFSLLAENLADALGENFRRMIRVGPVVDFTDADGDGVPLYIEQALAMNPAVDDRQLLPKMDWVGGEPVYGVRMVNGGVFSDNPSQYLTNKWRIQIEISEDLENWSSASDAIRRVETLSVNNVRVATYAPVNPLQKKAFFRTLVERR